MSIKESHRYGRTPIHIWGSQRSHLPESTLILLLQVLRRLRQSSASSQIQFFSIVLDVRHIPRMVVLNQYASAWENVVSIGMGEPHEHRRIA